MAIPLDIEDILGAGCLGLHWEGAQCAGVPLTGSGPRGPWM